MRRKFSLYYLVSFFFSKLLTLCSKIWCHGLLCYLEKKGVSCLNRPVFTGFPRFVIEENGLVVIGKKFICRSTPDGIGNQFGSLFHVYEGGKLIIGNNSGISNTCILCKNEIEIGDYVNIGDGCLIMDSNFHSVKSCDRLDRKIDVENATSAPVSIKKLAFIGARSVIYKGVVIGERSCIAAGSVVVKSVPDGELWGGNPAKFIKKIN